MIWSIAWKNIWRNKKRSLVVIVAVALGIIAGVFIIGFVEGWSKQRLDDAVYNEVSHIQIHNSEYLKNEETNLIVSDPERITGIIDTLGEVKSHVVRTKIIALAGTSWANTGVIIYGVDPDRERQVTKIHEKIVSGGGRYLDPAESNEILISDKTAELLKIKQFSVTDSVIEKLRQEEVPSAVLEKLEAMKDTRFRSPGDFREALGSELSRKEYEGFVNSIISEAINYRLRNKVQLTFSDREGNPVHSIFRVCGIYKTTNTGFDQMTVYVNAGELAKLYGDEEILIHEAAILLKNIDDAGKIKDKLIALAGDNSVRTWKERAPDAALMNDFMVIYYFIFIGIIMLALSCWLSNSLLMSVL